MTHAAVACHIVNGEKKCTCALLVSRTKTLSDSNLMWCRVYTADSKGPVILCLHGGGYTALTWALLAKQLKGRYHCSQRCTAEPIPFDMLLASAC